MSVRALRKLNLFAAILLVAGCSSGDGPNSSSAGVGDIQAGGTGGSTGAGTGGASMETGGTPSEAGTGGAVSGTGGGTAGSEAGGSGGAAGGPSTDGGISDARASQPDGSRLPPISDYSAQGPFATTTDANTGPGGKYTIFRPKTWGENGFLHPPIIFGPGIGMQATQLSGLLTSFASHGFVVISVNVLNGGPNDPGNRMAMLDGLNWILQQNSQAGIYQGKLDVQHAISMGYSVGGTAAVEVGGHEAVATTVSIHGHIATAALHGPMLQTSGTADTVGLPMQQKTFDMSQVQTFLGTVSGANHGYIQMNNGGVERPAIVAWLRYWIYNDAGGKHYFYGDDCVLCTMPWVNPQRKNWQ